MIKTVNKDNDWQTASINKVWTMSSCCKNGTNKKEYSDSNFIWGIEDKHVLPVVKHPSWKPLQKAKAITESMRFIDIWEYHRSCVNHRQCVKIDSIWPETHWHCKELFWRKQLMIECNQNNSEGLFRWELQQRGTALMRTLIDINVAEEKVWYDWDTIRLTENHTPSEEWTLAQFEIP